MHSFVIKKIKVITKILFCKMTEMHRFVTKKTTKCQKSKFNLNIKLIEKYLKHSYEELEYV